jgi:hypothetical protein
MIDQEKIRALLRSEHAHAVTVLLPMHVAGREVRQDPIRLRRLLDKAGARLGRGGLGRSEIGTMLAPAYARVEDEAFWRVPDRGLAVFAAPGFLHCVKVPIELPEEVVVGRHFHVKHLLPLLAEDAPFWILALSARRARLFAATRFACTEQTDLDLPRGVAEIAAATEYQNALNASPVARPRAGPGGIPRAHNVGDDTATQRKAQLVEYLHRVIARLADRVRERRAPLVVAAAPEARGQFKALARHLHVLDEGLDLNPDAIDTATLHRAAWNLVRARLATGRQEALDHFNSLMGSGNGKATARAEEIVKAARHGRIDTLFVADDAHLWGRFDADEERIVVHGNARTEDDDLTDYAAGRTLLQGGRVEVMRKGEVPRQSLMAAILRY